MPLLQAIPANMQPIKTCDGSPSPYTSAKDYGHPHSEAQQGMPEKRTVTAVCCKRWMVLQPWHWANCPMLSCCAPESVVIDFADEAWTSRLLILTWRRKTLKCLQICKLIQKLDISIFVPYAQQESIVHTCTFVSSPLAWESARTVQCRSE